MWSFHSFSNLIAIDSTIQIWVARYLTEVIWMERKREKEKRIYESVKRRKNKRRSFRSLGVFLEQFFAVLLHISLLLVWWWNPIQSNLNQRPLNVHFHKPFWTNQRVSKPSARAYIIKLFQIGIWSLHILFSVSFFFPQNWHAISRIIFNFDDAMAPWDGYDRRTVVRCLHIVHSVQRNGNHDTIDDDRGGLWSDVVFNSFLMDKVQIFIFMRQWSKFSERPLIASERNSYSIWWSRSKNILILIVYNSKNHYVKPLDHNTIYNSCDDDVK